MSLRYKIPTKEQMKFILTDILGIDNLYEFEVQYAEDNTRQVIMWYSLEDFGSLKEYRFQVTDKGFQYADIFVSDDEEIEINKYLLAIGYHYLLEDNQFLEEKRQYRERI